MNTADRSLAIVDYALRRRFSFITLSPEFGRTFKQFLKARMNAEFVDKITAKIVAVNHAINGDEMLRGMEIGHSYFCNFDGFRKGRKNPGGMTSVSTNSSHIWKKCATTVLIAWMS